MNLARRTSVPTGPRRRALHLGLALAATAVMPPARACQFFARTLTINHPWTRASAEGATTAKVCMSFQDVTETDHLIGIETPVAESADLGGEGAGPALDLIIPAAQTTVLTEKGMHLRLLGLKQPLQVGRSYPMTLVFANAGATQVLLNVDFARFF